MATVTYIGERYGDGEQNEDRSISINREFLFKSTDADQIDILSQTEVPPINSKHPTRTYLKCIQRTASPVDPAKGDVWVATAIYGAASVSSGQNPIRDVDPWKLPPYEINVYSIEYNEVMEYTYKVEGGVITDSKNNPSVPTLNTAGDRFTNLPTKARRNVILSFSYNSKSFKYGWPYTYTDTLNKNKIRVLGATGAPGRMKMNKLSGSFVEILTDSGNLDSDNSYWKISTEIELSIEGVHTRTLASFGYRFKPNAGSDPLDIWQRDSTGLYGSKSYWGDKKITDITKVSEPIPLGSDGDVAPPVKGIRVPAKITTYPWYTEDWSTLKLPSKSPDEY